MLKMIYIFEHHLNVRGRITYLYETLNQLSLFYKQILILIFVNLADIILSNSYYHNLFSTYFLKVIYFNRPPEDFL